MNDKIPQSNFQSLPRQSKRLEERHSDITLEVTCGGMNIVIDSGVYQTSGDTDLMIESVVIENDQTFLEVGCGSGVISIFLARRSSGGVGVDVNELAVANSQRNAQKQNVSNVNFIVSDVFSNVTETFDVIVCNPPYAKHDARDAIDTMFWDTGDKMKKRFFKDVGMYLNPGGKIYFGWANFADIDIALPFYLADEQGYGLTNTFHKSHGDKFSFYVFEFIKK